MSEQLCGTLAARLSLLYGTREIAEQVRWSQYYFHPMQPGGIYGLHPRNGYSHVLVPSKWEFSVKKVEFEDLVCRTGFPYTTGMCLNFVENVVVCEWVWWRYQLLQVANSVVVITVVLGFLFYPWAQWHRGRASDSRLREPGFEYCAAVFKPWASFFTLHCSSSLSWINESLVDMCTRSLRTLVVAYGWMLPREAEMVSEWTGLSGK